MKDRLSSIGSEKICPIAVIARNGKLLLGYRNYTPDKWKKISVWTCAGGRCNEGETVEAALRREVAEETGITRLEILTFIGEVPGAKEGDIVPIFGCTTTEEPRLLEPEKFSEWRWVDFGVYTRGELGTFNPAARTLIVGYLAGL